jgi:tetratricopeptide (TPR) repeat protein
MSGMNGSVRGVRCILGLVTIAALSWGARVSAAASWEVPRLASAEAQLARAVERKNDVRGLKGAARVRALEAALDAYRSVSAFWPDAHGTAAEAAFRSGELLRRLDRESESRAEFLRARELGVGTSFGVRAGLELGHLSRRAGDLEVARAEFEAVARDERGERRYRDDGALWVARMDAELGRIDAARRAWEALSTAAESPTDRIEAFDDWATSFIDAGDLEAAAGVLARCSEAMHDASEEETPLGERVRSALARMGSVRRLAQAIRARERGVTLEKHAER